MTSPADNLSDNDKKSTAADAGKALQTAGSSPINPFLAAASESVAAGPSPPRAFLSRLLDYSAHAAIIVGLVGFAWTVSDHVVNHPTAKLDTSVPVAVAAIAPRPADEILQLRLANQKMHDEIRALKTSIDTLRTAVRHDTTPEQVRMLSAGLESIKSNMGTTTAAITQLNGKVDKLQPGKLQQLNERVGRLEHQALDSAATGSIVASDTSKADLGKPDTKGDSAKSTSKTPAKPTTLASAEDLPANPDADKPQVISGWIVRDVYQGVALVEGRRGTMEVVPGVAIPGAGVVKSIDRHGNGWTVTTTKGQFASATQPLRDYRRNPYQRGGYAPYRYGY